jgi:hypothetical protein
MKKFLLSTILPAIALMALNSNAATSLTNFGPLTISWTILQQNEPLTNTLTKTNAAGKKATNTVYTYKASTSSSTFSSISLLNLISNSFTNVTFAKGDKLATDGENIYVVDSTGSNEVLTNLSEVLTVTYADSLTAGSADITTNKVETNTTYVTNITSAITTNTNLINTNVYIIIDVTNIMTNAMPETNMVLSTNIDIISSTNGTNAPVTNYTYVTNFTYTTNINPETNIYVIGTNITTYTNIDTITTATMTNVTTKFTYVTNLSYSTNVVPVTNYIVYTTNITTYTTTNTGSGTATWTTTSYFTLRYSDPANSNVFTYHGLASTAIDDNAAKNTATENFSVKSGVGSGIIHGKTTLISGTMTGSAKGKVSPLPE